MQNLDDREVMLKYQQGELEAMDELMRRYKTKVYHFAYRLTSSAAEAEDIAQEVFLRLHQYKDNYRPTARFSTWIFRITHNVCISRWRKNRRLVLWPRKRENPDELVEFPSPNPSAQERVAKYELADIVMKTILALPFPQREALILREFENLDYKDIARILRKSLGTVKTLIHRARLNLKDKLLPFIKESGGYDV